MPPRKAPAPGRQDAWVNAIVGHADVAPATLIPNPLNYRRHPRAQREALAGGLDELGWIEQIVVNRRTQNILNGHLRVELAIAHGQSTVPVSYVDLSEDQERLALTMLDPISAMAETDTIALNTLMHQTTARSAAVQSFLEGLAVEHKLIPADHSTAGLLQGGRDRGVSDDGNDYGGMDTTTLPAPGSNVHMVQIFLTEETWPDFKASADRLRDHYGVETLTDAIVECVRQAVEVLGGE